MEYGVGPEAALENRGDQNIPHQPEKCTLRGARQRLNSQHRPKRNGPRAPSLAESNSRLEVRGGVAQDHGRSRGGAEGCEPWIDITVAVVDPSARLHHNGLPASAAPRETVGGTAVAASLTARSATTVPLD